MKIYIKEIQIIECIGLSPLSPPPSPGTLSLLGVSPPKAGQMSPPLKNFKKLDMIYHTSRV